MRMTESVVKEEALLRRPPAVEEESLEVGYETNPSGESTTAAATAVLEKADAAEETLVMPYDYADNEMYYVENITLQKKPVYDFFKRAFDIFASLAALLVCAIPMAIIALLIRRDSAGPAIYKQERLGLNGKPFTILKFRTMCDHAEDAGAMWSDGDNDVRITTLGKILRKFRIDELPQLFCTLIGTMTLVGPRPERACFYEAFEHHVLGFHERLLVKPGITGLAQVNGGYDLAPHEKIVWDIEYIKKRSLWLDIKIMFKTVWIVFSHEGAK